MTSDEIISRIQSVGLLPPRVDTTSQKILDEINSEFFSRLVPIFRKARGGFFQDHTDYSVVADQAAYAIPERAIESAIDIIKYVDADGNEISEVHPIPLKSIGRTQPRWWLVSDTDTSTPVSYYLTQGQIVLDPVPSTATGSIRVYYARRPGKLVYDASNGSSQHTAVGTVTSLALAGGNTTITLNANHSGWPANQNIDLMSFKSPFKLYAKDQAATTAAAGTATILVPSTDLTTLGIVAGDFVTLAKRAYVPEIPEEWHELLLDLSVARWYHKMGNYRSEASARASAQEKLELLLSSTSPRIGMGTGYLNPFA